MRPGPLRFRVTPYKHQLKEYLAKRTVRSAARFWSMRTGKSKVTIDEIAFNWWREMITGVVIFAPNIAHQNWVLEEIPTHMPHGVKWEALIWSSSRARNKIKWFMAKFRTICVERDKLMILSINSEALAHQTCRTFLKTFIKHHKGKLFFVCDESHQFGAPGSKRTGATKAVRNASLFRRILSGTPIDESPMQAYSQFNALEPAALGFTTFEDYKAHFGVWKPQTTKGGQSFMKFLGPQNEEELKERMTAFATVVTREDAGLLAPIDTQVRFEMTDAQRKVWKALKENPVMGGKPLEGGALMLKFQQISSGFIIDENKVIREIIPADKNPRLLLTRHVVRECQGKVIVWCKFKYEIRALSKLLEEEDKFRFLLMYGEVPQAQKFANLRILRDDPDVKGIVGQPQSGGAGVDMRAARSLVWNSHTTSLIQRNQASDRASAIGKEAVDLTDVVAHNANDDYILNLLSKKVDVSERLSRTGLQELLQQIGDG